MPARTRYDGRQVTRRGFDRNPGNRGAVIPIQDLLHRLQWDPEFARGEFEIGYFDRVQGRILQVPLTRIHFEKGDAFTFELGDGEGRVHTVPLHRVREVYKDGACIWRRKGRRGAPGVPGYAILSMHKPRNSRALP